MTTKPASLGAIAVAGFLLAACTTEPAQPPLDPAVFGPMADQFEELALKSEKHGQHRAGHLIRWNSPIVAQATGRDAQRWQKQAQEAVEFAAELSQLSVLWVNAAQTRTNLNIRFVNPATVAQAAGEQTLCYTEIRDSDYVITQADIYIAPLWSEQVRHCLAEETAQAMGLMNDSKRMPASIFDDASLQPFLSATDEIMLRTLYDPRLAPGMTTDQIRPLLPEIMADLVGRD